MNFEGVKCDVCGKIKGDANKWIKLDIWRPRDGHLPSLHIHGAGGMDICSDTCLQKLMSETCDAIRGKADA